MSAGITKADAERARAQVREAEWPAPLTDAAFHGLAGEFVRQVEPHSEADPAALLVSFLAAFGSAAGRDASIEIEGSKHHPNFFVLIFGDSAKGRKGTSWGRVQGVMTLADATWRKQPGGLSSGEGLIAAVRDAVHKTVADEDTGDEKEILVEEGINDKRLLVVESEFGGTLKRMAREGNSLSAVLRQAWDDGDLASMTKTKLRASNAHISLLGHITTSELRSNLKPTDQRNGLANRCLFVATRRSKLLSRGGRRVELEPLADRVRHALRFVATERPQLDLWDGLSAEAGALWDVIYASLSDKGDDIHSAVTSRAETQVIRLALVYALLDGSAQIEVPHLHAALALWRYCDHSARYAFAGAGETSSEDKLLDLFRKCHPEPVARGEMVDHLGRHVSGDDLTAALEALAKRGLVRQLESEPTGGRPRERWGLVPAANGNGDVSSLSSLSSLSSQPEQPQLGTPPSAANGLGGQSGGLTDAMTKQQEDEEEFRERLRDMGWNA